MRYDLWFAWRRIRLRPQHSAVVILTLGLGIGAALAVLAVVDALLLRPLPFPEADRLVRVTQQIPSTGFPELSLSGLVYRRIRSDVRSLRAVAAYDVQDRNLVRTDRTRRLSVAQVSASFFDVLQVTPRLGRAFTAQEDIPNGPRVVVISDRLWRDAWQADPAVIGAVAELEGEPFTIIGVMPPSMVFPSRAISAWEPSRIDPAAIDPFQNRYTVLARLADGVSIDQAQRDITAPIRAVGREYPGPHPGSALDPSGYRASVRPLSQAVAGDARPVILLLLGGVVMLLLLTCANVVNLQLAGAMLRGEELAVRGALGATRSRLIRGALVEGLLLSGAGALVGCGVALGGARMLASLFPAAVAVDGPLLGGRAVLITTVVVLAIGALVGAVPAALVAHRDPARGLRDRAAGSSPLHAGRVRRLLAAAQVALAVLLLHNAGLLIASARAVQRVALGFRPDSTISLRINVPAPTFSDRSARELLLRRIVSEVASLPGVVAAGLVNALPLTPGRQDQAMAVEGRPFKADGTDPLADYRVVSAGYFDAMRIPLVRGRLFTDDDASATFTPLVISRSLERRLFPDGADPIGQRLRFGPGAPWMPIVGVVADARNRSLTEEPRPELYTPGLGTWSPLAFRSEITIVARTQGNAMALAAPIERLVRQAAPDVATDHVATLGDIVRDAQARMTTATRLMTLYAIAALLLAVAGTYGVLAFLVTQRRRELAVRMALGAGPRAVLRLVARESGLLVGIGLILGLAGAMLGSRLLAGLLYGIGALDLRVTLLVVACAAGAGAAAAVIPARRATRTDPSAALRAGG